ncbi:ribonuclease P protein component [Micromonospora sp. NPDC023888]|uniref:ribonuclease P protein component n=1 Tax=Micromonospora sp. NPDC023888 TaxID=3155607 RepID=UPI00340941CF
MLAAAQRLRRSTDFAAAVRGGRRAGRGAVVVHLTVPVIAEPDISTSSEPVWDDSAEQLSAPSRAGFVVSKAVGNAVVRNRVKRRLRALVRDRLTGLPAGSTLVVRALPAAADASFSRLATDLDAAIAVARSPRERRPR